MKEIVLQRQKGRDDLGDLGTKDLDLATMWRHAHAVGFETRDERSELSLRPRL